MYPLKLSGQKHPPAVLVKTARRAVLLGKKVRNYVYTYKELPREPRHNNGISGRHAITELGRYVTKPNERNVSRKDFVSFRVFSSLEGYRKAAHRRSQRGELGK